ncbi:hypothetical protein SMC26_13960 [Actinomadura fulvescens]|uniref:Uncharacterized protein n=1 Tax=Actinomadura fulvescens TaxID=46160 RepID=A0ABN3Q3K1_9ACTN
MREPHGDPFANTRIDGSSCHSTLIIDQPLDNLNSDNTAVLSRLKTLLPR